MLRKLWLTSSLCCSLWWAGWATAQTLPPANPPEAAVQSSAVVPFDPNAITEAPLHMGYVSPSFPTVPATEAPLLWAVPEYLLWWSKNGPLTTPLATTSNNPAVNPGALNTSGTSVLFGGPFDFDAAAGMRLTLGLWFDNDSTIGLEMRGFLLERVAAGFSVTSDANGNPYSALPITNAVTGVESAYPVTIPDAVFGPAGALAGGITVDSRLRLWGLEANTLFNLMRDESSVLNGFVGFRYIDLTEDVTITSNSTNVLSVNNGGGGVAFANLAFGVDGTVTTYDSFFARNQFYGGQLGLHWGTQAGAFLFDVTGRVALGATQQQLNVAGQSSLFTGGTTTTLPGGVYALPSNIGTYNRTEFSVIPEIEVKVGYQVSANLSFFVGYDFLYWTSVVRPGDQISRNISVAQVPTDSVNFAPNPRVAAPLISLNSADYWAQGLQFGAQLRW